MEGEEEMMCYEKEEGRKRKSIKNVRKGKGREGG